MESVGEIKKSLAIAIQRLDMQFNDIDKTSKDIYEEFQNSSLDTIRESIRKGSLGYYGRTFKLSTQEVCIWINQNIVSKRQKMI